MSDPGAHDADLVLAGEVALGLLDGEELRAAEARLQRDAGFRALHVAWVEGLAPLAATAPAEAPLPELAEAVERLLFPEESRPWWRRLGVLSSLAGALAAALVLLVAVNLGVLGPMEPGAPLLVADLVSADGALRIGAVIDPAAGEIRLDPAGAAPGAELWLVQDGQPALMLGILPATGPAVLPLPASAALAGNAARLVLRAPGAAEADEIAAVALVLR